MTEGPAPGRRAGGVAVVLGAAGGLGEGVARRLADDGMRLVLADVDRAPVHDLADDLAAAGHPEVLALRTDVTSTADVTALRDAAVDRYGEVNLVFNTIGVTTIGPFWKLKRGDWDWVMSVNLAGALNVTEAFLPQFVDTDQGQLIHTSSTTAVAPGRGNAAPYVASKAALVALCEGLQQDLWAAGSQVTVHVAFPGTVQSEIATSERNRPAEFGPPSMDPADVARLRAHSQTAGLPGTTVAANLLGELDEGRFYLFGHDTDRQVAASRYEDITSGILSREAQPGSFDVRMALTESPGR